MQQDSRETTARALAGAAIATFVVASVGIGMDGAARLWLSRLGLTFAMLAATSSAIAHRKALAHRLSSYFLHIDDPLNLAYTRIVVFSVIAFRFSIAYAADFARLPSELIEMPVGMGWAEPLVPRSHEAVEMLGLVVRVSAVAAALGFATRVSTWVAALSACLFFVIPQMFGHVGHDRHHLLWFALLLAASPCGDRLAIDRAIRTAWARIRGTLAADPGPAIAYGFPRRAMLFTMGIAYFFSGFWKLASAGVDWFATDNLANLVAKLTWAGLKQTGPDIAAFPLAAHLGAFATIAFELSFVFALLWPLTRVVVFTFAFAFHVAIYVFIGISFGHLLYCYLGLIDVAGVMHRLWPQAVARGRQPRRSAEMPSIVALGVAALVIGTNATFGALHINRGWPFACYPAFDILQTRRYTSYVVEGETATGELLRLHDAELGGPLGRHFYNLFRANQARTGGLEDADGRESRWRLLCTFLWQHHPRLHGAHRLHFVLEDLEVRARDGQTKILGQRPQFECSPPTDRSSKATNPVQAAPAVLQRSTE